MVNIERAVENSFWAMFTDCTVHPSGVITGRKDGRMVRVFPNKDDSRSLLGWRVEFHDSDGLSVRKYKAFEAQVLVHDVLEWSWLT